MNSNLKDDAEALLREALQMQKDIAAFIKSKSEDPVIQALALHTACNLVLDDYEDESEVLGTFYEWAPRLDAIVDLGHNAVLKTLEDGSYGNIFAVSVELAVTDSGEDCDCPDCCPDGFTTPKAADNRDVN